MLIMLLSVVSAYAQDTFEKDGLRYRITNSWDTPGEVYVTKNEEGDYSGDITIPAEVLHDKTYKVVGIDSEAFKDCTDLTSVIIGNNVTSLEWRLFMNCEGLTSVTIPSSVTNISSDVFQNCTSLESVTIPNSVTSLGGGAFSGCIKLSTVTLSDKLETIEGSLFSGCERLESITIPNSVTTIGYNAFSGCSKLSEVNLSNKLKTIQWGAFQNCESLESIVIPSTVTKIGGDGSGSVFSGCTKLSSVNIPDGVKTIENSTFSGCASLTSIELPTNVTKIESSAFSNCTSLTSINIPGGVKSIESSTFYGCTSLSSITIPDGVTTIKGSAFSDCKSLTTIIIPNSVIAIGNKDSGGWINGNSFSNCIKLTSVTLSNQLETIENNTFSGCTNLESITIPSSVTKIGEGAFYSCSGLKVVKSEIASPYEVQAFDWASFQATLVVPTGTRANYKSTNGWKDFAATFEEGDIVYDNERIDEYGIIYRLKQADDNSVYYTVTGHTDALKTEIVISSKLGDCPVKAIEGGAFNNCSSLTSITIPSSVTSIGEYAFSECNSVKVVNSKISEPFDMSWSVFNGWQHNATLVVPVGKVNAYKEKSGWNGFAFVVEEGQTTYDVPQEQTDAQGLKYSLRQSEDNIVYYAVTGHTDALKTEIEIPADLGGCPVKAIESSAFRECGNLTSVKFGDNLTTIGWDAFYKCSNLTSITLPSSVTTIEGNAFSECSSLTSITLPGSVTLNNGNPFYNCASLSDVKVVVTDYAGFCNNQILGRLENPMSYYDGTNWYSINIALHVLDNEGNEITDYVIPEGVTTIGKSAFKGYTGLSSISIPNSVTTIGDGAFYGCSNLKKVTSEISTPFDVNAFDFMATPADPLGVIDVPILNVPRGSRADYRSKSGWNFAYIFEKGETIYDRRQADKQGLKYTLNQANDGSFYYSVTGHSEDMNSEIVIPAEIAGCPVKAIGGSFDKYNREGAAFYNCSDLTSIKLGKNVSSIGDYAFFGCTSLNSITLSKKLESIGNGAFSGDWSSSDYQYHACPITSIAIPGNVKTIGDDAFHYCSDLVLVTFEVDEDGKINLTSIGENAFAGCSFPSITVPNSVTTIGGRAFADNNKLTTATLGDALTEIKNNTFESCNALTSITIPDGVTSIGNVAFRYCYQLASVKLPKSLTSMGENVFESCPLTSIELPDAFTVIPANIFKNNNLKYIKLGNNVQSIGKNAFGSKLGGDMSYYNNESDSEELIVIEISTSTPPQIDKKAFPNIELSDINVIVPDQAAQSAYRSADVWGEMQLSNQNNYAEVTVETAGNIGSELRSKCKMEPSKVVNLKVNGTINAKDFSQMKLNMNSLLRLDLSDCDITEIPNEALSGKAQLQELKLPTKLKTIGQSAFKGCTYLTGKLDLPSVTSIGESAFQGTNYTEVSLPRSLKTIGHYAFYNLPLEQRLEIPSGVTSIGDYAFADTHIHSRLELPDDVNLGAGAFKNTNISKLQLPRNIKSLSREAFQGCTNLEEADFSNTFTEVFDYAFDGCSSMTYVRLSANTTYLGEYTFRDTQLEYLNVPSNVEVIKQGLLKNCKNLQSLSLPANVQTLETEALSGCSGLRNMSVEAIVPPTVKKNAFRSINTDLCLISIPTQSIDLYGNADYWGRFVNMRNDIAVETEGNGEIAFESVEEGEEEGSSMSRTRGQRIAAARAKTRASGEEEGDQQWTVANNGSSIFIPKNGKVRFFITPAVGETITSATLDGVDITNDIVNGEYVATADKENGKLVVKFSDSGEAPDPGTATVAFEKAEYTVKMGETFTAPTATTTPEGLTLTYSSSDETVATVDAKTGAVTLVATGTTNITALFAGNDDYKTAQASYKLTVKEASSEPEPQVDTTPVSIKISSAKQVTYMSDKNLDFTGYSDLKAYVATGYDKASGTIWLTRVKEVPANTGILLMGESGTYEIPAKTGASTSYYMNLFKGTIEGTTIFTTEGSNTNYYLSNGESGVGFYKVTKADGVTLAANRSYLSIPTDIPTVGSTGGTETIKVSAAGQVPYCNSQSLDFSSLDAQGVKAYTATGYDYSSGTIWLTRVKQVPAETGILIMAPQGEYQVPTASVASVYGNMFRGTLSSKTIFTHENIDGQDYINYYLSNGVAGVGFYRVTKEDGVTIGANRCYLPILNKETAGTRSESSGQSQIAFQESDEVIGIRLMRGIGGDDDTTNLTPALSKGEGEGEWYTLQGQRIAKPGKGIYIKNGKKVVIK